MPFTSPPSSPSSSTFLDFGEFYKPSESERFNAGSGSPLMANWYSHESRLGTHDPDCGTQGGLVGANPVPMDQIASGGNSKVCLMITSGVHWLFDLCSSSGSL